jgi:hypothetical protein
MTGQGQHLLGQCGGACLGAAGTVVKLPAQLQPRQHLRRCRWRGPIRIRPPRKGPLRSSQGPPKIQFRAE